MSIRDKLEFVKKNFFRNKKNFYVLLQFVICSLVLMLAMTFKDNFHNLITETLSQNIGFRSLSVTVKPEESDFGENELLNVEHVVAVYSSKYDSISLESSFKSNGMDGYLDLLYSDNSIIPDVLYGEKMDENDTGVAICPLNFYPDSRAYDLFVNYDNIMNGRELIGSNFQVEYYSYKYDGESLVEDKKFIKDFKIVGVYDSKKTVNTFNSCYISSVDMKSMKDDTEVSSEGMYYDFVVIVDSIENISKVQSKILDLGFLDASIRSELDQKTVSTILILSDVVVAIILVVIFTLSASYIKKKIILEQHNMGILRSEGFSRKELFKLIIFEQFFINLISYFFSIILYVIIYQGIMFILNTIFISSFTVIPLTFLNFTYIFIYMVIFTTCIDAFYIKKYNNKKIVEMIRSKV